MRTSTETLVKSLNILANDIQSEDGVANAAIAEGALRIEELNKENLLYRDILNKIYIARNITLSESEIIKELKRIDSLLREENYN
jgi:hypothetical protein